MSESHEHTDHPICPECAYVDYDDWEWGRDFDDGQETQCGSCGATYFATRHVCVTWSTEPPKKPNAVPQKPAL